MSHTTAGNDLKALGLGGNFVPSMTVVPVDRQVSPAELKREAIQALRVQSSKSAVAARELARISIDLERDDRAAQCEREHVDRTEYDRVLKDMWSSLTSHFEGPLVADIRLKHGLNLRGEIQDAIEDCRLRLNATIESRAKALTPVVVDITPSAANAGAA